MELRREEIASGPVITGFSGRGFRVGERVYARGLLIDPGGGTDWEAPAEAGLLVPAMLGGVLDIDPAPEFLLLGTGVRLGQPPRPFVRALEARGIGVEALGGPGARGAGGGGGGGGGGVGGGGRALLGRAWLGGNGFFFRLGRGKAGGPSRPRPARTGCAPPPPR